MKIKWLISFFLLCIITKARAQSEFPKGWIFPLEMGQGVVTNFHSDPDLFLATLAFSPQVTVVPGRLRLGLSGGGAFYNKRIYGTGGGRVSLMISKGPKVMESTVLNAQLVGEFLFGTKDQRLVGGGFATEIGHMATISMKAHRDYVWNNWWFSGSLGIHLFKKKAPKLPEL
ncbi:hypothetical protein [Chitinophaga barathri]|uniref:Outer membrane protein beta-barrel domain-containing protein n=1 Tax=Chitinophaga barathri TaxID=1647451 RepID=A0A3N4MU25_9BACT|nr:hypothetical protein [Chitinophaga barathri]RPD38923.1 hypothetical protein EG028_22505 [Chitinophaga barathri]